MMFDVLPVFLPVLQEFTNLLALRPGQDLDQILAELETPGSKKKGEKREELTRPNWDGESLEVSWLKFPWLCKESTTFQICSDLFSLTKVMDVMVNRDTARH
jgi:hypothetical protein